MDQSQHLRTQLEGIERLVDAERGNGPDRQQASWNRGLLKRRAREFPIRTNFALQSSHPLSGGKFKMAVDLPLTQMSLEDKIQAMELLWSELSKTPEQVVSPSWHEEELHRRRQQIQDGTASFENWTSAMAELKAELHGYQAP